MHLIICTNTDFNRRKPVCGIYKYDHMDCCNEEDDDDAWMSMVDMIE